VVVPILVAEGGPVRRIIDGNNRKQIADQLGYECPEIVKDGLCDEEQRLLARSSTLHGGTSRRPRGGRPSPTNCRRRRRGQTTGSANNWASIMPLWPASGRSWRQLVKLTS
jgi:hypothetical protein